MWKLPQTFYIRRARLVVEFLFIAAMYFREVGGEGGAMSQRIKSHSTFNTTSTQRVITLMLEHNFYMVQSLQSLERGQLSLVNI